MTWALLSGHDADGQERIPLGRLTDGSGALLTVARPPFVELTSNL